MTDGYYWFVPAVPKDGALSIPDAEGVQIVQVFDYGFRVAICGSDVTYDAADFTGLFIGPLEPPGRQSVESESVVPSIVIFEQNGRKPADLTEVLRWLLSKCQSRP